MIFNQVIAGFEPWTSSTEAWHLSHLSSPSYPRKERKMISLTGLTQSPWQPSLDGSGSLNVHQNTAAINLHSVGMFVSGCNIQEEPKRIHYKKTARPSKLGTRKWWNMFERNCFAKWSWSFHFCLPLQKKRIIYNFHHFLSIAIIIHIEENIFWWSCYPFSLSSFDVCMVVVFSFFSTLLREFYFFSILFFGLTLMAVELPYL